MIEAATQNMGRRRISRHDSCQKLDGASLVSTASTAPRPPSSIGAV
jgi:hypothetical protein